MHKSQNNALSIHNTEQGRLYIKPTFVTHHIRLCDATHILYLPLIACLHPLPGNVCIFAMLRLRPCIPQGTGWQDCHLEGQLVFPGKCV